VYFLVTKSAEEISAKFQNYQAWVEAQGFGIKRFRCDNGSGEYNNSVYLALLGEKGISYELAPPYTLSRTWRDRLLGAGAGATLTLVALWLVLVSAAAAAVILRA